MAASSSTSLLTTSSKTSLSYHRPAIFLEFHHNWPEPLIKVLKDFKANGGLAVLNENPEPTLATVIAQYEGEILRTRATLKRELANFGLNKDSFFALSIPTYLLEEKLKTVPVAGQDTEYDTFITDCKTKLQATSTGKIKPTKVDEFIRQMNWLREATSRLRWLHTIQTLKLDYYGIDKPSEPTPTDDKEWADSTSRRNEYMARQIIALSKKYKGRILIIGIGATHYNLQACLIEQNWEYADESDWIFVNHGTKSSLRKDSYMSDFKLPAEEKDLRASCPLGLTVIYPSDSKDHIQTELARKKPRLFSKISSDSYMSSIVPEKAEMQYQIGLICASGKLVRKNEIQAAAWFSKAAVQGHVGARTELAKASVQFQLALAYGSGTIVIHDNVKAAVWFSKAASQGHAGAKTELAKADMQYQLAFAYVNGTSVTKDEVTAAVWFSKAAVEGHAGAKTELAKADVQYQLALAYVKGIIVTKDVITAAAWFSKAAAEGHSDAKTELDKVDVQYRLALAYLNGIIVTKDAVTAAAWFNKAAAKGHIGAKTELAKADMQYQLALAYSNGTGITKNEVMAAAWFSKAAAGAHAGAKAELAKANVQYALAICYETKTCDEIKPNSIIAAAWFSKSADQGHIDAKRKLDTPHMQYRLGVAYLHGNIVVKNRMHAAICLHKASEKGILSAQTLLKTHDIQYGLACAYSSGTYFPLDKIKAAIMFNKAAISGSAEAKVEIAKANMQHNLGLCYETGSDLEIKQSDEKAIECFTNAVRQGHIPSYNKLGMLQEKKSLAAIDPRTKKIHLTHALNTYTQGAKAGCKLSQNNLLRLTPDSQRFRLFQVDKSTADRKKRIPDRKSEDKMILSKIARTSRYKVSR